MPCLKPPNTTFAGLPCVPKNIVINSGFCVSGMTTSYTPLRVWLLRLLLAMACLLSACAQQPFAASAPQTDPTAVQSATEAPSVAASSIVESDTPWLTTVAILATGSEPHAASAAQAVSPGSGSASSAATNDNLRSGWSSAASFEATSMSPPIPAFSDPVSLFASSGLTESVTGQLPATIASASGAASAPSAKAASTQPTGSASPQRGPRAALPPPLPSPPSAPFASSPPNAAGVLSAIADVASSTQPAPPSPPLATPPELAVAGLAETASSPAADNDPDVFLTEVLNGNFISQHISRVSGLDPLLQTAFSFLDLPPPLPHQPQALPQVQNKTNSTFTKTKSEAGSGNTTKAAWESWKQRFNQSFSAETDAKRFQLWLETDSSINHLNDAHNSTLFSHNLLSALTDDEKKLRLGVPLPLDSSGTIPLQPVNITRRRRLTTLPLYVDWQAAGNVGPVKDQESCGSCYVFAAVAQIESATSIASRLPVVPLSEEYALDCSTASGGGGCHGGYPVNVMQTMQATYGGIIPQALDPYTAGLTAAQGQCPSQYLHVSATSPPGTAIWQTQAGALPAPIWGMRAGICILLCAPLSFFLSTNFLHACAVFRVMSRTEKTT